MNTGGAELFHPPGRKMGNVQDGADHVEQVYQQSNNGYVLLTRGKKLQFLGAQLLQINLLGSKRIAPRKNASHADLVENSPEASNFYL